MDFQVSVPGPFTYLVHEHARSILAIQELQREVTSLLEFRDNVLHALPQLHRRGYHSLTSTHDPSSSAQISQPSQASPIIRGEPSPSKSNHSTHHMTSAESGRQQRPITTSGGVTTTTNSGNSSSNSSTGGKSLSETHSSAVADSGFSTDKAGGSMGKSSSSSAGDHLSGADDHRWISVEPELPLGSAEDELWHLLDVIQRKGTRLRNELERAERSERERASQPPPNVSSVSDPLSSPRPHSTYHDFWPHSLPGPVGSYPSRSDLLPPPPPPPPPVGMPVEAEAWATVERFRQDRQYLVGRVNWAEAEVSASHQRLLDLYEQLLALAGEKRRLEDQVRALRLDSRFDPQLDPRIDSRVDYRNDLNLQFVKTNGVGRDGPASTGGIVHSVMGGVNTVHIVSDNTTTTTNTPSVKSRRLPPAVTVSVASGDCEDSSATGSAIGPGRNRVFRSASSVRINNERDVVLPRVLKVPIRDRTQRHLKESDKDNNAPSYKETKKDSPSGKGSDISSKEIYSSNKTGNFTSYASTSTNDPKGSDRVVIERERKPGKADGGLSMPVSLLKGGRIKVQPNKQRISAILREKDVIELQRQLLTTVMETEVLKKQIETAGDEWVTKTAEWETEQRHSHSTITSLRQENLSLKNLLDDRIKIDRKDACVGTHLTTVSIATMTEESGEDFEAASHKVHPGPNVKYDVVIYEESSNQVKPSNATSVSSPIPPETTMSSTITATTTTSTTTSIGTGRKVATIEKPPRRCRELRPSSSNGTVNTNHSNPNGSSLCHRESTGSDGQSGNTRDSVSRGGTLRPKSSLVQSGRSTPTVTPRSSPAPSINSRGASRTSADSRTTLSRSSSVTSNRMTVSRRDSTKINPGPHNGNGKTNGLSSGGQHKDAPVFFSNQNYITKSKQVNADEKTSRSQSPHSNPPLTLCDLKTPSLSSPSLVSQKFFKKNQEQLDIKHPMRKRLSVHDVYNSNILSNNSLLKIDDNIKKPSNIKRKCGITEFIDKNESVISELDLADLRSGSESSLPSSVDSNGSYYDSININSSNDMTDDTELMHVEVAFEWSPVPTKDIRYLPPAAHMWNPDHTLFPNKRLPPVKTTVCNVSPGWMSSTKHQSSIDVEEANTNYSNNRINTSASKIIPGPSFDNNKLNCSADSLEQPVEAMGKMRNKLRSVNGAMRVKNVDRPSVLDMVQGSNSSHLIFNSKEINDSRSPINSIPKISTSFHQDMKACETSIVDSLDQTTDAQNHKIINNNTSVECENAPMTNTNKELDSQVRMILARIAANSKFE